MNSRLIITRLHSSRMRTARALTVSPSMLCAGGWGCLLQGGVYLGGSASRGVCSGGGGCLLPGEGVSAPGGVVSQHALKQTPPPVNRITHACENITLPPLRGGR